MTLSLFFLGLRVKWYLFCEEVRVRARFYSYPLFRLRDRALRKAYSFRNPYRMSRRFLQKIGAEEIDSYGETPITTWALIVQECGLTQEDYVFDLGCGRGRGVFFLSDVIGCRSRGIEWNPEFVMHANHLQKIYSGKVEPFICQNMTEADLKEASAIYLCGTCLDSSTIEQLIALFRGLSPSVKIITVSFSLADYSEEFRVIKSFWGSFPWGEGEIFLNSPYANPNK